MTTATEHARTLIAAILPERRDLLERALRDLVPQQIPDRILANLYTLLGRFHEVTGAVMTRSALGDLMRERDAGTVAAYQEIYDELAEQNADDAAFRWSLEQLRELAAERATNEALTSAMTILTQGVEEKGEVLRGHHEARAHLLARFADIDRDLAMQHAPEGELRGSGAQILAQYEAQEKAQKSGLGVGVKFGIPPLDDRIGGLHRGELILVAGFTSDGKTSLCVQLAWSAAVEQGKNVLFLTTETVHDQVRRRLIARHSCLPGFELGEGLNSRDIKYGTLTAQEKPKFINVVRDLDSNPGYGRQYIAQVPRGASTSYVEQKIARVGREMPVDLVIMDYLALLRPERKRTTVREELSETLKNAKQISTTAQDGLGVPFFTPWQVSRAARVEAEQKGSYTLSSTSETSETSNSADTLIGLLAPMDNEARSCGVKVQLLKHRDGEKANSIELRVDYATSRFTGRHQQGRDVSVLGDPVSHALEMLI